VHTSVIIMNLVVYNRRRVYLTALITSHETVINVLRLFK
jgi:hypothetical protein